MKIDAAGQLVGRMIVKNEMLRSKSVYAALATANASALASLLIANRLKPLIHLTQYCGFTNFIWLTPDKRSIFDWSQAWPSSIAFSSLSIFWLAIVEKQRVQIESVVPSPFGR